MFVSRNELAREDVDYLRVIDPLVIEDGYQATEVVNSDGKLIGWDIKKG